MSVLSYTFIHGEEAFLKMMPFNGLSSVKVVVICILNLDCRPLEDVQTFQMNINGPCIIAKALEWFCYSFVRLLDTFNVIK